MRVTYQITTRSRGLEVINNYRGTIVGEDESCYTIHGDEREGYFRIPKEMVTHVPV